MTSDAARQNAHERIRRNIQDHGRHIYAVFGGDSPRFLYTIGLYEKAGAELLFAGGAIFHDRAVAALLNRVAAMIEDGQDPEALRISCDDLGPVRLVLADQSWVSRLCLGALDYYGCAGLPVWQILPDDAERTSIDIPNTAEPFSGSAHPVWQWLEQDCPYPIPEGSVAITDLDLMLGYAASEAMRWQATQWQVYSGDKPDSAADTYHVPLATLLAFDASLLPALDLGVGRGLIREFDAKGIAGPWSPWGPKDTDQNPKTPI